MVKDSGIVTSMAAFGFPGHWHWDRNPNGTLNVSLRPPVPGERYLWACQCPAELTHELKEMPNGGQKPDMTKPIINHREW